MIVRVMSGLQPHFHDTFTRTKPEIASKNRRKPCWRCPPKAEVTSSNLVGCANLSSTYATAARADFQACPSYVRATPLCSGPLRGKIGVFFEASGVVRDALIARGWNAISVDLRETERPGPHIRGDVFDHLDEGWTGSIMHPSCTYLTCSAAWAFNDPDYDRYPGAGYHQRVKQGTLVGAERRAAREQAWADFRRLLALPFPKAIENPAPSFVSRAIRPPDQTIQPYDFGEDASKRTGLWLDRLPPLKPTKRILGRMVNGVERWANQTDSGQNRLSPSADRWAERSETYPGIAAAFADQWGAILAGVETVELNLFGEAA